MSAVISDTDALPGIPRDARGLLANAVRKRGIGLHTATR
jgi:hypothetical protein